MKLFLTSTLLLFCFFEPIFQSNTSGNIKAISFFIDKDIKKYDAKISEVTPSLVSADHTAEGFLVTLKDGTIIHFFRLDPGLIGNHVGNNGKIVKRMTYDGGYSWTEPELVYDSEYDDRNIHGGIIGKDTIILNFRRFNATKDTTIDMNIIYSFDGGNTWTDRQIVTTNGLTSGNHSIIFVPGKGFMNIFCKSYYLEIRFSPDGLNWDNVEYVWDYLQTKTFKIGEGSFAYLGGGKMMGLIRNNIEGIGSNFFMVTSKDYGNTWTEPISTNISDSLFCPSPLVIYDSIYNDVWTFSPDRRLNNSTNSNNMNSCLWVYRNTPDEIFGNPQGFTLEKKIIRPNPTSYRFYGYPIATRKADGNYLVIFTECYKKSNQMEDADFYQFEINYTEKNVILSDNFDNLPNTLISQNYPNPVRNFTKFDLYIPNNTIEKVHLNIYNTKGKTVSNSIYSDLKTGINTIDFDASSLNDGIYFYEIIIGNIRENKKMIVLKD